MSLTLHSSRQLALCTNKCNDSTPPQSFIFASSFEAVILAWQGSFLPHSDSGIHFLLSSSGCTPYPCHPLQALMGGMSRFLKSLDQIRHHLLSPYHTAQDPDMWPHLPARCTRNRVHWLPGRRRRGLTYSLLSSHCSETGAFGYQAEQTHSLLWETNKSQSISPSLYQCARSTCTFREHSQMM